MQFDRPISIAIILFVVLLLVFFLVVPQYKTYASLQIELAKKKAEHNAEIDYYNEINKTWMLLQNRKEDLDKIDNALPENPDLGKIIYFLQRRATENGLMVKDVFLSRASQNNLQDTKAKIKETTFSMDLMGDYFSLGKFLADLEVSDRIFEVTNISFGSGSMTPLETGGDQLQFELQQTYVFNLQVKTHSY